MAFAKSFAQFPFVVSRTFCLPNSLLGNEVAIFDHPSGAQSVPPGTTPERGCIRRISRSACLRKRPAKFAKSSPCRSTTKAFPRDLKALEGHWR